MTVKAKGKKKIQKKKTLNVAKLLEQVEAEADVRFQYAQTILEANDDRLCEVVDSMVAIMGRMAPDPPVFRANGIVVPVDVAILRAINRKLHTWMAVRLLVAAAEWDIRISGFKLPKKNCAKCGKRVK